MSDMRWQFDQDGIDWNELSQLCRIAPLGDKKPEHLKLAFTNSLLKCFVFDADRLIAAGRGRGLGKSIIARLRELSADHRKIILYANPGKKDFYRKLGFLPMRTATGVLLAILASCGGFTDAATRLAYDIEAGVDRLGSEDGSITSIQHATPSKSGECTGPYKVQLDRVGAIIVWCDGGAGNTVSSHSTSHHARYVDTPQTFLLNKPAGEALTIDLERRGSRAVILEVR